MQMHGGHGASWCRYGLTETSPVLTVRRKGYRHNVRGTIGKGPACVFKHSHAPDLMLSLAGCCDQPSCAAERPRGPTHPPTHPHITHTHTPRARAQPLTPPHSHPTPASTPTCCVPRAATGPAIPGTELRIVDPATLQDVPDGQQGLILAKGQSCRAGHPLSLRSQLSL